MKVTKYGKDILKYSNDLWCYWKYSWLQLFLYKPISQYLICQMLDVKNIWRSTESLPASYCCSQNHISIFKTECMQNKDFILHPFINNNNIWFDTQGSLYFPKIILVSPPRRLKSLFANLSLDWLIIVVFTKYSLFWIGWIKYICDLFIFFIAN